MQFYRVRESLAFGQPDQAGLTSMKFDTRVAAALGRLVRDNKVIKSLTVAGVDECFWTSAKLSQQFSLLYQL